MGSQVKAQVRAGKKRHKCRQEKVQGQARKGTSGGQEKAQGPPRKGTRAAKKRHKSKQVREQGQARKGTSKQEKAHA
jgi:hypothetical protein